MDCAVAGMSGQGSEDFKELSEAVECNDRELAKSDKDKGDSLNGNESPLSNSAQLLKSFFAPSGLTLGFVMRSKVGPLGEWLLNMGTCRSTKRNLRQ